MAVPGLHYGSGVSLVVESRGCTPAVVCELLTAGTFVAEHGLWGLRASAIRAHGLRSCGPQALVLGLSACGTWASLSRGMRALPGPGVEPTPPALAGGFFTAETPGSAHVHLDLQNSSLPWKKRWL